MIDSLVMMMEKILETNQAHRLGLDLKSYIVATFHRPSNVDDPKKLKLLVEELLEISEKFQIVFPAHPRTLKQLRNFSLEERLRSTPKIRLLPPLRYIEFMNLVLTSKLVMTDSGGVQEETTYLQIPCLTMRENTERPITLTEGTNRLVSLKNLKTTVFEVAKQSSKESPRPRYWDGQTASRIVSELRILFGVESSFSELKTKMDLLSFSR